MRDVEKWKIQAATGDDVEQKTDLGEGLIRRWCRWRCRDGETSPTTEASGRNKGGGATGGALAVTGTGTVPEEVLGPANLGRGNQQQPATNDD